MTFKIDQMEAIINFAEASEDPVLITCSGNIIDAMKVLKPFSSNVSYVYSDDIGEVEDPVFILEREGEVILAIDDLKTVLPSNNLKKSINSDIDFTRKSVTIASVNNSTAVVSIGNIGIMIANDMYNKDISEIDTLIIMFDSNYIKSEQVEDELMKHIKSKPKSTSYVGSHKSLSYIDIADQSHPKTGEKHWRRIVLEDTMGKYNKSQVYNKLSGDNPLVVNLYTTTSNPKYTLESLLIGG